MAYAKNAASTVAGGDSESHINDVNVWMRSQPWYQQFLTSIKQDPSKVKLSKSQRARLMDLAQANGLVIDEGKIEVDPAGNFNPIGHKLRNFAIGAGIAGGALTGFGLAGMGPLGGVLGGSTTVPAAGAATGAASGAGGVAVPTTITGLTTPGVGAIATSPGVSIGALGAGGSAAAAPTAAGVSGAASGGAGTAAANTGRLWGSITGKDILQYGVPAAAGLAGTYLQTRAEKQAAELQAQAAQQALDWQKQQYAVRQRQLAPTIGVGNAATLKLGDLMGLKAPEGGYQAPPETQVGYQPPAVPRPNPDNRNPNAIAMTTLRSPDGKQTIAVPSTQADVIQHYVSQGAQVVQ